MYAIKKYFKLMLMYFISFYQILIKLKDRKRLTELRASIYTSKNVDYVQQYIDNALKTSTIKWKN